MVVLEKWFLKPIYLLWWWKERYYLKRFLVETENKEETFIGDPNSQLEIVSTDYRSCGIFR
jgi:topoisomerase-4 subunit A